jgi:hypothetical protein
LPFGAFSLVDIVFFRSFDTAQRRRSRYAIGREIATMRQESSGQMTRRVHQRITLDSDAAGRGPGYGVSNATRTGPGVVQISVESLIAGTYSYSITPASGGAPFTPELDDSDDTTKLVTLLDAPGGDPVDQDFDLIVETFPTL